MRRPVRLLRGRYSEPKKKKNVSHLRLLFPAIHCGRTFEEDGPVWSVCIYHWFTAVLCAAATVWSERAPAVIKRREGELSAVIRDPAESREPRGVGQTRKALID